MAEAINTDSIISTINAIIPVLIVVGLLSALMKSLGSIKF